MITLYIAYHVSYLEEDRFMYLYFTLDLYLNKYTISQNQVFIFFKLSSNTRGKETFRAVIHAWGLQMFHANVLFTYILFLKIPRDKNFIAFCRKLCTINHLYD